MSIDVPGEVVLRVLRKMDEVMSMMRAATEDPRMQNLYGVERNVELYLIRPILEALEWDFSLPWQVDAQTPVGGAQRPDYTLKDQRGRPSILVEAKAQGRAEPQKNWEQVCDYLRLGPVVALTDGIQWSVYTRRDHGGPERPAFKCNLSRNPLDFCARLVASLWQGFKDHEEAVQTAARWAYLHVAEVIWEELQTLLRKTDLIEVVREQLARTVAQSVSKKGFDWTEAQVKEQIYLNCEDEVREALTEALSSDEKS